MISWAARAKEAISQTGQGGTDKTDETKISRLLAVSAAPASAALETPEPLSSVLAVPHPAMLEKRIFSSAVIEVPERWCWPHSLAMNGQEIDIFKMRLDKLKAKGLPLVDSEALADKLVLRDRDQDDRRVCLECRHLAGHGAGSWRCSNWQTAGVATRSHDAQLPASLATQLQRCAGFGA
jgi:hypothetical protein